ncbi:MAG TPA: IS110 family transposase [Chthoniobacterales bacterium]|nr:IS110 family transposase [Chthoniobacterales bacterium]
MKKRYFMGIDVAKATLDFCLLSKNATLLWSGRLANESQAIGEFLAQLKNRGYKLAQIHFCCESTGVYGQRLVEALQKTALALSVLNPAQVKFFALSVLRRTKNDKVDAEIIARFCRERTPLATRPLRPIESQLKMLVRERESRVNEQSRERNRAKKDPYQIGLPKLIGQQRKSRLKQLAKEIAQFDAAIDALINADADLKQQSALLCSIPGIAKVTAAKLLSELAGKEFQSARQLAAYAGLTPQECRSGYSAYGKTVLSKIGNAFLRKALYLPAAVAKRWCKPLQPWITSLQNRKLHVLAIRGAIMRKLLHIAFGVLANQQPFNPALVSIPKTS